MGATRRKQGGTTKTPARSAPKTVKSAAKASAAFPLRAGLFISVTFLFAALLGFWIKNSSQGTTTVSEFNTTIPVLANDGDGSYVHPYPLGAFHAALSVVRVPHRGKGVVYVPHADQPNEPIPVGTSLIREQPLFVLPEDAKPATIHYVLPSLSAEQHDQFFALANALPDASETEEEGILATNAMALGAAGAGGSGVFANASRINHSCAPNAVFRFRADLDPPVLTIQAVRPILPGDEVRTAYVDATRPRDLRREYIKKAYGFECDCEVCALEGKARQESETRRGRIDELRRGIGGYVRGEVDAQGVIDIVKEIAETSRKEHYDTEYAPHYADATTVSARHADPVSTRHFASLAAKAFAVEMGADHPMAHAMAAVEKAPWSHTAWGAGEAQMLKI